VYCKQVSGDQLVDVLYARSVNTLSCTGVPQSDARLKIDYQRFTDRIRTLQRTLLTAHISLMRFDEKDVEVFRDDILPPTRLAFMKLRRDIDMTIREIGGALGRGPMFIAATQSGYLECLDQQRAATMAGKVPILQRANTIKALPSDEQKTKPTASVTEAEPSGTQTPDDDQAEDVEAKLRSVTQRLQRELGTETPLAGAGETGINTPTQTHGTLAESTNVNTMGSSDKVKGSPVTPKSPLPAPGAPDATDPSSEKSKQKYGPTLIKTHFEEFKAKQKDILVQLLTTADPGTNPMLKIDEPGPSISELYGGDYLRGNVQEGDLPTIWAKSRKSAQPTPAQSKPESMMDVNLADDEDDLEEEVRGSKKGISDDDETNLDDTSVGPTPQAKRNETLVRVYSLLFAWE
jgi:hypothetical protein